MDRKFAATGEMPRLEDSTPYLAWTNSHSRLCDRLGIKERDRRPRVRMTTADRLPNREPT